MQKTKVHIGNDPYLVRTAIQSFLAQDPRFDAILLPGAGEWPQTEEGDILIVSGPGAYSAGIVVRLSDNEVEITSNGSTSKVPYEGLPWLTELLAGLQEVAPEISTAGVASVSPGNGARAGPTEGGRTNDP
ncbi:MAG TPA: hypothetical protein VG929_07845 [Actinomycetota bacterium]|nr:hypothetical protein [Actinomycetota bacterium]